MVNNQDVTILIVEDSPTQSALLGYLLEKHGYKVLEKENGMAALATIIQQQPDLIISDVLMPEMDGFSLCRAIKDDQHLKEIPVILMTSLEGIEEIGKGLEAGADNFIYKPYKPEALLARIQFILNKQKLIKENEKQSGYQIHLGGKKYIIQSPQEQILGLLASTFEDAVSMNQVLKDHEIELQSAKEAADLANIKKGKFLAIVSHEIRTPMMGITGLLELLSLSKLDSDQQRTVMTIYESGKSLLRIINDILDFSKIDAGKMEISPNVDSVHDAIKQLHQLFSGAASRKRLVLKSYCDPAINPALRFDSLRLKQILGNFLSNAINFTLTGEVEIRAEQLKQQDKMEHLRFLVKDTGIGISPEKQLRLFQPFVEIDECYIGGTGLGLVISQQLAKLMNGTIEIVSELNHGTTMILTLILPIADPKDLDGTDSVKPINHLSEILANQRSPPSISEAEKENTLVLVVDNHPINRKILLRQLNSLGYAVEEAESGTEALMMLKSRQYALVLTDCNMPIMSGYRLAQNIREYERENNLKRIPIIACTANAQLAAKQNCLAAGMDDVLVKPISLMDLLHHVPHWRPLPEIPPIDQSMLTEIVGDDEEARRDILKDFKRINSKDCDLLNEAMSNKDLNQVLNLAHQIKGACQLVGAKKLALICQKIEEASRKNDEQTVEDYRAKFKQEAGRLKKYLNSILSKSD